MNVDINFVELAKTNGALTVEQFIKATNSKHDANYFKEFWPAVIGDKKEIVMDDKMVRYFGFVGKIDQARASMRRCLKKITLSHKIMKYNEALQVCKTCSFECKGANNLAQLKQIYVLSVRAFKQFGMMVETKKGLMVYFYFYYIFRYFFIYFLYFFAYC